MIRDHRLPFAILLRIAFRTCVTFMPAGLYTFRIPFKCLNTVAASYTFVSDIVINIILAIT